MESHPGRHITRRMAGNFGSSEILRKYGRRGRAKAAGEEELAGMAALLSVPVGILDDGIKVSLAGSPSSLGGL